MVQKQKSLITDFEAWYRYHVIQAWESDAVMTWAKNSRNVIEKEGDLKLQSSIQLTLILSYFKTEDVVLPTSPALLAANTKRLLRWAGAQLPTGVADAAVLKVERRWVANSLPTRELVYALTYVYARLYEVCSSLARHLGETMSDEVAGPTDLDPMANDVSRVRYIKCAAPGLGRLRSARLHADPDFRPPPAFDALRQEVMTSAKPSTLAALVGHFGKLAQVTFDHWGYHVPMLFLFDDGWEQIDYLSTEFSDQADKFIFWRNVADRAGYLRASRLVWISESWIRDQKGFGHIAIRNLPIVGERLHVIAADIAGSVEVLAWSILRDKGGGSPKLQRLATDDPSEAGRPYFLEPVIDAMRSARSRGQGAG